MGRARLGGGVGLQELEAQAVAVRSYVMSTYGSLQGYFGYADICDNVCQSYLGITNENAMTTTATTSTPNTVVLMPNGTVARTQYSSSTGGYSAGGHLRSGSRPGRLGVRGRRVQPAPHLAGAGPGGGHRRRLSPDRHAAVSVGVSQRNNLGDLGGRVLQMTLQGSAQSVTISGDTFASQFASYGLQSNWFAVTSQASGGVGGYWLVATDGGIFSFGNAAFHGSAGNIRLTKPVVGMAADPRRRGLLAGGARRRRVLLRRRRLPRLGGQHQAHKPVVGMAATPDGGGYWLVASDGGVFSYGDAAFHGSAGNIRLTSRWWAWRPPRTAAATGWWPATGACSPTATPPSTARPARCAWPSPSRPWRRPPTGPATGSWRATGECSASATPPSKGRCRASGVRSPGVAILPTATGAGYLLVTTDGRAVDFGDAPQFGDVADVVVGYSGHLVGGAHRYAG